MISFRFHIVSIVAVFVALAIGIGMGAAVIDRASVDLLHSQLNNVRNEANAANQRSDQQQHSIDRSNDFANRVADYAIAKQLTNVPVTIIASRGIDQASLGDLHSTLTKSGAQVSGTLWLPSKLKLDDKSVAAKLQSDLEASSSDPDQLRTALIAKMSAIVAGASPPGLVSTLVSDGLMEWDGDAVGDKVATAPWATSRLVMASGYNPSIPNDQFMIPLMKSIAAEPTRRIVAIEAGRTSDDKDHAVFLGPVRNDGSLAPKVSSVDDIEQTSGEIATVLALAQLASGKTGHYGVGAAVDGPIPKST